MNALLDALETTDRAMRRSGFLKAWLGTKEESKGQMDNSMNVSIAIRPMVAEWVIRRADGVFLGNGWSSDAKAADSWTSKANAREALDEMKLSREHHRVVDRNMVSWAATPPKFIVMKAGWLVGISEDPVPAMNGGEWQYMSVAAAQEIRASALASQGAVNKKLTTDLAAAQAKVVELTRELTSWTTNVTQEREAAAAKIAAQTAFTADRNEHIAVLEQENRLLLRFRGYRDSSKALAAEREAHRKTQIELESTRAHCCVEMEMKLEECTKEREEARAAAERFCDIVREGVSECDRYELHAEAAQRELEAERGTTSIVATLLRRLAARFT